MRPACEFEHAYVCTHLLCISPSRHLSDGLRAEGVSEIRGSAHTCEGLGLGMEKCMQFMAGQTLCKPCETPAASSR